jgi:hypothetical protein
VSRPDLRPGWLTERMEALADRAERAEQRVKQHEDALRRYGDHAAHCAGVVTIDRCLCGWLQLRAELSESEES